MWLTSDLYICASELALDLMISNTLWRGDDATQVYSTEEVCKRVGN